MNIARLTLSLLPIFATLVACAEAPQSGVAIGASEAASIEGLWTTQCHGNTVGSGFISGSLNILAGSLHAELYQSLNDSSCALADLRTAMDSTYQLGGAIATPANSQIYNSTALNVSVTPLSDVMTANLNSTAYCGLTNWQTNVAQSVGLRVCGNSPPAAGHVVYGVVSQQGNALFFGLKTPTFDGSTPARRPTSLNVNDFYIQ